LRNITTTNAMLIAFALSPVVMNVTTVRSICSVKKSAAGVVWAAEEDFICR
jgi:hypothetical protein